MFLFLFLFHVSFLSFYYICVFVWVGGLRGSHKDKYYLCQYPRVIGGNNTHRKIEKETKTKLVPENMTKDVFGLIK